MQKVKCGLKKGQAILGSYQPNRSDICLNYLIELIEEGIQSRTGAVKLAMNRYGTAHKSTEMLYGRAVNIVADNRAYRITHGVAKELMELKKRKAKYKGKERQSFKFRDNIGVKPYDGRPAEKAKMIREYNELRERASNE